MAEAELYQQSGGERKAPPARNAPCYTTRMSTYADLELGLHRWSADDYSVDLRYSQPSSDADVRLVRGGTPGILQLDLPQLQALSTDSAAYGRALGAALFADPAVAGAFAQARASAESLGAPLRVRLFIGPTAPELHALRWETLRTPDDEPLLLGEQILFSRYVTSGDRQPIQARPKSALRALVAVAGPEGLAAFGMAPVDVAAELARAQAGLPGCALTALAGPGQATADRIFAALRDGVTSGAPYDILYLVAHGTMVDGETWLWLEHDDGTFARVVGGEVVQRMRDLARRPLLVALVACQSAGDGASSALAALGPRLAEAGVPAVVAMQGAVSMELAARFMPVFFQELQRDGQIDRAMAVARGAVRDDAGSWAPVLFMRLKSGRLWYVPGFGDSGVGFEKWPALLRYLRRGRCTPVIGTHLSETTLGSSRDIARAWADTYSFPMEPHDRDDLPQVAQYLAVNQDPQFPRDELIAYIRRGLLQRYGPLIPNGEQLGIDRLFAAVGRQAREANPADPYKVLAELPLPIYVTTNASNMLAEALRAAGKHPVVEICRWNEDLATLPSVFDGQPAYQPSPELPLVYHLFGTFEEPDSLVLTEDDYFDFLIGVSTNKQLIPIAVREALADSALLFLGFRIDDWSFRVVFRTLMSQQGRSRRTRYAHIAGQLMPEENEVLEPERASKYLERYFAGSDVSIFWGSTHDFSRALLEQL